MKGTVTLRVDMEVYEMIQNIIQKRHCTQVEAMDFFVAEHTESVIILESKKEKLEKRVEELEKETEELKKEIEEKKKEAEKWHKRALEAATTTE